MPSRISRFLSLDDLWSAVGYGLVLAVNRLTSAPFAPSDVSLLASGMLAIMWVSSAKIRARNMERNPNARVLFWGAVAAVSLLVSVNWLPGPFGR